MSKLPIFKSVKEALEYASKLGAVIDTPTLLTRVLPNNAKDELLKNIEDILNTSSMTNPNKKKFINKMGNKIDKHMKCVKKIEVRLKKMNEMVKLCIKEATLMRQLYPLQMPENEYTIEKNMLYATCSNLVKNLVDHNNDEKNEMITQLGLNINDYPEYNIPLVKAKELIKGICDLSLLKRDGEYKLIAFAYSKENKKALKKAEDKINHIMPIKPLISLNDIPELVKIEREQCDRSILMNSNEIKA